MSEVPLHEFASYFCEEICHGTFCCLHMNSREFQGFPNRFESPFAKQTFFKGVFRPDSNAGQEENNMRFRELPTETKVESGRLEAKVEPPFIKFM